ncbi:DNA polymerase-3 subunit epsilon [Lipingzhangella halophila]|uniref:DNA polymerase-3 subunit epsilon n=1 Tax=Lipingzhangella halophila TaxID=1783352 RepID=A0A7W7VZV7_9ACTN|nr:exonuclease domain-containing protein [Lipingzhangella halophila]MBB4929232.1 DNA polymerase-3 subunit epsilon [Lipingzhangella halophila]
MRNRYPGTCTTCGTAVATGAGVVLRENGRWRSYCSEHEPRPTPPPRGDHPGWHTRPIVGYDCETSSNDPREAFLVSAALVDASGTSRAWLVNPGDREIPADAVEIHGISTEAARAEGAPAEEALGEIAEAVTELLAAGTGMAIFNAPFDLGVLAAELRRHDLKPLTERLSGAPRPIIDPLVIDRGVDPYRRGPRNLGAMCEFYGVALAGAHTAHGDAAACLELSREIGARHPDLAGMSLSDLHDRQIQWALDYARNRQRWLDERRPGHGTVIDGTWPLSP